LIVTWLRFREGAGGLVATWSRLGYAQARPGLTLYLAIAWSFLFPISTFLHECGHAMTALALTNQDVTILLGDGRKGVKWQRGRLRVVLGWFTGFVGFTKYDQEQIASRRILWITLAGPLVSLLLAFLSWSLTSIWGESRWLVSAMRIIAQAAFAQFLFTILPLKYPRWFLAYGGKTSDGWRIVQLLRKQASAK